MLLVVSPPAHLPYQTARKGTPPLNLGGSESNWKLDQNGCRRLLVSNRVTATIRENGLSFGWGLKQIPAGPSRVSVAAKAPPKRMGEVWGTGFVGYVFGHGGYGGYAANSIYSPQTGLRINS